MLSITPNSLVRVKGVIVSTKHVQLSAIRQWGVTSSNFEENPEKLAVEVDVDLSIVNPNLV